MKEIKVAPIIMGAVMFANQVPVLAKNKEDKAVDNLEMKDENKDNLLTSKISKNIATYEESDEEQKEVSWVAEYVAKEVSKNVEDITYEDYKLIKELRLPNKGLKELPTDITKLINLEVMDLSGNEFESFNLYTKYENLKEFNLSGNKLAKIPNTVKYATNLENVDLSDNQIYETEEDIKAILEKIPSAQVNLDKNLINDDTLNPNPKQLVANKATITTKVGKEVDFQSIVNNVTVNGEKVSSAHRLGFFYTYPSDEEPYFDGTVALRTGTITGEVSLATILGTQVKNNPYVTTGKNITINILENKIIAPKIEVEDVTIFEGDDFDPEKIVKVTDDDEDIMDYLLIDSKVKNDKPGTYTVSYSVTDSDNQTTTKKMTVTVKPDLPPVIHAEDSINIKQGEKFNPSDWYTAFDEIEGDLTKKVTVEGNDVEEDIPGEYSLTLRVEDRKGQVTVKTIKVTINKDLAPEINASDITIYANSDFKPLDYAVAFDEEDGDISKKIKVDSSNVNINKVGEYNITYSVEDSYGNKVNKTIKVNVIEDLGEAPIIHAEDKTIVVGQKFNELENITASDKEDGNLTDKIKVDSNNVNPNSVGVYSVTYSVVDSKLNKTTKTIKVTVVTNESPVINAIDKVIKKGEVFKPLEGVTATDKEDGDLTSKVSVKSNNVNVNNIGEYQVNYSVSDTDGNTSLKTIKVSVVANIITNNNSNISGDNNSTGTTKPQTGDNFLITGGMAILSGTSLVSINRKKKNNKQK